MWQGALLYMYIYTCVYVYTYTLEKSLACLGERLTGSDTQASPEHILHAPLPAFRRTSTIQGSNAQHISKAASIPPSNPHIQGSMPSTIGVLFAA